ncbi:MAG: hypothetical protein CMA76_01375, partial [Euryarchaeota archaeon]|nr:hypothetical protein [Euryarchaeota archaeon]MBO53618.1 hypothetical protein [Euryarchaeota archaeon]
DRFQTDEALDSAIELADRINEGENPHPSNIMLDSDDSEIRRVVTKKRRDDDSPADFDLEI